MKTDWRGIDTSTTPVDPTLGTGVTQTNTTMRISGELARRHGFLNTSIARRAGAVYNIIGATPPYGSYVFVGWDNGTSITVNGDGPIPPPPWNPPKRRRPRGDRDVCTIWGPFVDSGTDSGTLNAIFNLPADSCPGQFFFSALEGGGSGGSGAGGDYGYSIDVNDSSLANIPAGTLVLDYTVTASCLGGLIPGSWSVSATTP
jgi:hypothetical protein